MTSTGARHRNSRAAVAARRAAWNERLTAELARLVAELRQQSGVERVVVFGSVARGDSCLHSDLDLVVIQRTELPFRERLECLYRLLRPRVPTDLLAYTPEEWASMCAERTFARRVEREGRTLYAATGP
jgi:predicted nucleotidyltransferase